MTKQEYYNLLKKAAEDGTFPASENYMCLYRGKNGKKCAVGLLIPDEKYKPDFENEGKLLDSRVLQKVVDLPDGMTMEQLSEIQDAHDSLTQNWDSDWDAERFLIRISEIFA